MPPQRKYQNAIVFVVALAIVAASFGSGVYVGYERRPAIERIRGVIGQETDKPAEVDFSQFWEVWSKLEERYVDRATIDRTKLVQSSIAGLVRGLGDPYTAYLPPVQAKQFQEDVHGSFGGIGAEIGIRRDVLTVISPLKGSPAERAGLKTGDRILKINATSTAELSLEDAVGFIRGPIGTTLTLSVARETEEKVLEIKIVRETIKIPILETADKGDGVFYIHLLNFSEKSPMEFRDAIRQFLASGEQKLVLDVRGNPGGFLDAAVDVGSWFIPAGEVIAREHHADGSEDLYRSSGYRLLERIPVVVLVNQGSASASEILAGALRDDREAKLVGEKTFGKGSVQEVDNLSHGASLKITIAKWLTPKGDSINDKGLEPDVKISIKKEDTDAGRDPQLERAIELVKTLSSPV